MQKHEKHTAQLYHNIRPAVEMLALNSITVSGLAFKKHSIKQKKAVTRSIQAFGMIVPILIDKQGVIINGHLVYKCAKELGYQEIPVIRVEHLTKEECQLLGVSLNKLAELSEWDKQKLGAFFKDMRALNLDLSLDVSGFEIPEIDFMVHGLDVNQDDQDPVDQLFPTDLDAVPIAKNGDVWLLGEHKIFCGNCLDGPSYEVLMNGQKAAMVFCDPPYNVKINGHVGGLGKIQHPEFLMASGEMTNAEYGTFLETFIVNLCANSIDGSIHYICIDWRHVGALLIAAEKTCLELKNICVWVKDNGGMGSFYRSRHELVCVFKNGTAPHKNNFLLGQHGRYRSNVWEYPGVNSFTSRKGEDNPLELHPTVKPVRMVEDAIMDCSDHGDLIVDCFLGSGTTLLAAQRTGRTCHAMELDPRYVDIAIRRFQKMTGLKATHVASGQTFEQLEAQHVVR